MKGCGLVRWVVKKEESEENEKDEERNSSWEGRSPAFIEKTGPALPMTPLLPSPGAGT